MTTQPNLRLYVYIRRILVCHVIRRIAFTKNQHGVSRITKEGADGNRVSSKQHAKRGPKMKLSARQEKANSQSDSAASREGGTLTGRFFFHELHGSKFSKNVSSG